MASEYKYDEGSETWPYFVLAMLVFILVPVTYQWAAGISRSSPKQAKGAIVENHHTLGLPHSAQITKLQSSAKSARIFNKNLAFIVVGWALVVYIWITYAQVVSLEGFFDPHTILDIPYTASEREIKSRYRKLTLKFHPDKIGKDLGEEAKKDMEAAFIRINTAYKALTDEATKNNLRLYGHPDGQQEVTHGIAIPRFLVEGKYSSIMIVIYFLLIGVVLPLVVGTWWSNVKAVTKKGLYVTTATFFARKLADKNPGKVFTPFDILDWVLQAEEIAAITGGMSTEEIKSLVMSYLDRNFPGNDAVMLNVVAKLPFLIQGFIDIAVVFRSPDVILPAYELQKAIVQASSPLGKHKELLQLPYVDKKIVEAQDVKKIGKLLTLSKEDASKALGITDSKKLDVALAVAKKIPFIRILDTYFKVPGETIVPPNSSVHMVVKFLIKSYALKSCPDIAEERLVTEETFEDLKDPLRSNEEPPYLPAAYAPYFPTKASSSWEGYVINQKDNKLLEGSEAAILERADLSNLDLSQKQWEEAKEGEIVISTFKIKIPVPAPPTVGPYHFRLILKNNAYFGNDVDIPVILNVENPPVDSEAIKRACAKEEQDSDEDSDSDISDPEEDSLAGALAAMRGQNVKKVKEEESGDESDADSVFTDINTDTEDEQEDEKN